MFSKEYYFSKHFDQNLKHVIHNGNCKDLPITAHRIHIGSCKNSNIALKRATLEYLSRDFCYCPKCCFD